MSNLEQKVENLEKLVEELQLENHAAKVAISVLSTCMHAMMGEGSKLGDIYLNALSAAEKLEFKHPTEDGYSDRLNEKVAALLGKVD